MLSTPKSSVPPAKALSKPPVLVALKSTLPLMIAAISAPGEVWNRKQRNQKEADDRLGLPRFAGKALFRTFPRFPQVNHPKDFVRHSDLPLPIYSYHPAATAWVRAIAKVTVSYLHPSTPRNCFNPSSSDLALVDVDGELSWKVYRRWKGYFLRTPCLLALRGFACQ